MVVDTVTRMALLLEGQCGDGVATAASGLLIL